MDAWQFGQWRAGRYGSKHLCDECGEGWRTGASEKEVRDTHSGTRAGADGAGVVARVPEWVRRPQADMGTWTRGQDV